MVIDKNIWDDFGFFTKDEQPSVFDKINFTQTNEGKNYLKFLLTHPLDNLEEIGDRQATIQFLLAHLPSLPTTITNGSLLVVNSFYDTPMAAIPKKSSAINAFFFKQINPTSFSLCKYSVQHCLVFLKGMQQLYQSLKKAQNPYLLQLCEKIYPALQVFLKHNPDIPLDSKKISNRQVLEWAHFFKYRYKKYMEGLLNVYAQLDAYRSLALAVQKNQWHFPIFCKSGKKTVFEAKALFHPLLPQSTAYTFQLTPEQPFLFLTGANMAGKSTFIKSIGIALLLAQMGMAVPAESLYLSVMNGLSHNFSITDNLSKGESYFYNEIQGIKNTFLQINTGQKWLVLIDELFKGTNIQDAMKCSTEVIKGLVKHPNALFVLSTHLYEIAIDLYDENKIQFKYFETILEESTIIFSYQLKKGVSQDRLGYKLMEQAGILALVNPKNPPSTSSLK